MLDELSSSDLELLIVFTSRHWVDIKYDPEFDHEVAEIERILKILYRARQERLPEQLNTVCR